MFNNALRFFFRSSLVVPEALQAFSVCRLACVVHTGFWKLKQSCGSGVVLPTTAGGSKMEKAGAEFRCKAVCL